MTKAFRPPVFCCDGAAFDHAKDRIEQDPELLRRFKSMAGRRAKREDVMQDFDQLISDALELHLYGGRVHIMGGHGLGVRATARCPECGREGRG